MSLQKAAEEKMEKAIKATNDDEPQIAVSETDNGKIKFSGDVLRKFLEWIPLENLPNVTLASRRFWSYCDENFEHRKHVIQCLIVSKEDSSGVDQLQVVKRTTAIYYDTEKKTVEFAEVASPTNFQIKGIVVTWNVGERAMDFLRLTANEFFVGATLEFACDNDVVNIDDMYKFLRVFNKCAEILVFFPEDKIKFSQEFFSTPAISNCNRFEFNCRGDPDLDHNSVFNWLHSPPTIYPKALLNYKRFFSFRPYQSNGQEQRLLNELLPRITEKFLEDNERTKFIIRFPNQDNFPEETFRAIRLENPRTGELLFTRICCSDCDLIRCLKEEEDTIASYNGRLMETNENRIRILTKENWAEKEYSIPDIQIRK